MAHDTMSPHPHTVVTVNGGNEMAARTYSYYAQDGSELSAPHDMQLWQWKQEMPEVEPKRIKYGLGYAYGYLNGERVRVDRVVAYKNHNPSLHKCGARCRSATGHNCECSCGGEFHGVDA